jgi:hypothetical protein
VVGAQSTIGHPSPQPPFYNKAPDTVDFDVRDEMAMAPRMDLRSAANFGAIGSVIAHEITHGYDDKGRQFDGDGNLNDWWTEEDGKLFEAKTKLMAKQVGRDEPRLTSLRVHSLRRVHLHRLYADGCGSGCVAACVSLIPAGRAVSV